MREEDLKGRKIRRWFVYGITTLVVLTATVGILYGLRPLILPFIMGAFLAYLFKPLAKTFQGNHWIKYVRVSVFIVGTIMAFSWMGKSIKEALPSEKEKLTLKVRMQYRFNERYTKWMGLDQNQKGNFIYQKVGQEVDPLFWQAKQYLRLTDDERVLFLKYHKGHNGEEPIDDRYYDYYLQNAKINKVDVDRYRSLASEAAAANEAGHIKENQAAGTGQLLPLLMKIAMNWIVFPLAFLFILFDKGQIMHFFMQLVPNRYFELTYTMAENVDEALGKYIRGTMVQCSLVGLTLFIGFFLSGIEFKVALIFGVLGGITNAIPFVGAFMACVAAAIYALIAENVSPILPFINEENLMLAVIMVVAFANLLDNAIYQPLVVGSAVSLHPLVVIMGVFGGSLMFGFAGLLLAIPTIVILSVVTKTFFRGLKDYNIV